MAKILGKINNGRDIIKLFIIDIIFNSEGGVCYVLQEKKKKG